MWEMKAKQKTKNKAKRKQREIENWGVRTDFLFTFHPHRYQRAAFHCIQFQWHFIFGILITFIFSIFILFTAECRPHTHTTSEWQRNYIRRETSGDNAVCSTQNVCILNFSSCAVDMKSNFRWFFRSRRSVIDHTQSIGIENMTFIRNTRCSVTCEAIKKAKNSKKNEMRKYRILLTVILLSMKSKLPFSRSEWNLFCHSHCSLRFIQFNPSNSMAKRITFQFECNFYDRRMSHKLSDR